MRLISRFNLQTHTTPSGELMEERIAIQTDSMPLSAVEKEEAKNALIRAIKSGILSKERYMDWRSRHNVSTTETLNEYQIVTLYGDIMVLSKYGTWCPTPF